MPIAVPAPGSDGPAKGPIKQPEVGLTVGLTPRISPNGLIFVDLNVERASVVKRLLARRGEWVRYSTPDPGGAEYLAVCVPAFSHQSVHRDED